MKNFSPAVDEYILNAEEFARPVMEYCRQLIHAVCPDVVEGLKWSIPHFDYKGHSMFVMAAYKNHCSFTFLKSDLMSDERLKENSKLKSTKRYLGKITKLPDLPAEKVFIKLLTEAVMLNEKGVKIERPKSDKPVQVVETPDYFLKELECDPKAKNIFESKTYTFRKNYIIWITDAKTEATRQKRIEQSMDWIAEGKGRFWQSEK